MELNARLYHCVRCHRHVIICSHCDHGNIYCGTCAPLARQASLRAADQRYQNTTQGKLKHAERQRRYRERHTENEKKVTDHTSLEDTHALSLQTKKNKPENRLSETNFASLCCHFCEQCCSPLLRQGFLRTSSTQPVIMNGPLGP